MSEQTAKTHKPRRRLRRVVIVTAAALVAVLFLLVVTFLLPPVRNLILGQALEAAKGALPGDLDVDRAAWPSPGTIELDGILWTDGPDTLLVSERVAVSVKLFPLIRKDVDVRRVDVLGVSADAPAIAARFASPDSAVADTASVDGAPPAFPRPGSMPGVPSIAVREIRITANRIAIGDGAIEDVEVKAGVTALHGSPPGARIERVAARGGAGEWVIEDIDVDLQLDTWRVQGRAAGRIGDEELFLELVSDEPDHIGVRVSQVRDAFAPDVPGVTLDARLDRDGLRVRGAALDVVVRTPSSRELSELLGTGELPDLGGIVARIEGNVETTPTPRADAWLRIDANDWFDGASIRGEWDERTLSVDLDSLRVADLATSGLARLHGDSLTARVRLDVTGDEWLRRLGVTVEAPDNAAAALDIDVARPTPRDPLNARLRGDATWGGVVVRTLRATAALPPDATEPVALEVVARVNDVGLALGADVTRGANTVVRLSPVAVSSGTATVRPGRNGRIEIAESGAIRASGIAITGDAGEVRADGRWSSTGGEATLRAEWPRVPTVAFALAGFDDAVIDSLRASWKGDAGYAVRADVSLRQTNARRDGRAQLTFTLPGPEALRPVLPAGARTMGLGALRGRADARFSAADTLTSARVKLSMSQTDWIDSLVVAATNSAGTTTVDTLVFAVDGIRLNGGGDIRGKDVDAEFSVDVEQLDWVEQFTGPLPDARATANARVTGRTSAPDVTARIDATIEDAAYTVPAARIDLSAGADSISARLELPDGATTGTLALNRLVVEWGSAGLSAPLPGRVRVDAEGDGLSLTTDVMLSVDGGFEAAFEELALGIGDRAMRNSAPFVVATDSTGRMSLQGLALEGSLGRLEARGAIGAGATEFSCDIELSPGEVPAALRVPPEAWLDHVDGSVTARDDSLSADLCVVGFQLADGSKPRICARLKSDSLYSLVRLTVGDSTRVVDATIDVPVGFTIARGARFATDDSLRISAKVNGFPVAVTRTSDGKLVRVDAEANITGSARQPRGRITIDAVPTDWPELAELAVRGEVTVGDGDAIDVRAVTAHFQLEQASTRLLVIDGECPLRVTPDAAPYVALADERDLRLVVTSEPIPLEQLSPLMPPDISLGGSTLLSLRADGSASDPNIAGSLKLSQVEVSQAGRFRVNVGGDLGVDGHLLEPIVRGNLTIDNGLIRIPEELPNLHPSDGEAILVSSRARGDSAATTANAKTERKAPVIAPDFDVRIRIPSGFWIRGRGLDVELAGDLQIVQKGDKPTVTGELRTVRGRLIFLGRSFELKSGTVTFYGDEELVPSLNVVLSTTIEDAEITVTFGGNALDPELELGSNPDMPEGDIMSYLTFGKPLGDLDDNQVDLVQQRATEIAAAMGLVRVQESIARQLGVDMVTIRQSSGNDDANAIVLGKYLNPKILLTFERLLEEQTAYFINLEYLLTQNIRLETLYGNQDKAGVEIEWSLEYGDDE